ncbi:hypothetical protein [Caloranaerobacter azorensis]|uniref:Uncharacterized protein n=1 Tax=Caloranaerobacter azorensis TaxID=116090 RepID=A0A6P1YDG4_9FIRM|nr:hypothetical protein [Caloranaerobacter azorensis]QIB26838.1 hypothetical protein G3A45_05710 [Caloranaerobacter azorensis]
MIRKLTEKGIEYIQLHLCTILPGTELFEYVKDNLTFSKFHSDFGDSIRNEKIDKLISKYPEIFPQYFNFETNLRKRLLFLDRFITYYYSLLYKYLPSTYEILMNKYHNDLLELFFDFRRTIPYFATKMFYREKEYFSEISNEKFVLTILEDIVCFINKCCTLEKSSLIKEICKFEMDIFRFTYIKI